MRSLISSFLVAILAVCMLAGCAGGGTAPSVTPDQAWAASAGAAKGAAILYVATQCKDGKILGVQCSVLSSHIGPVIDTLAADFKPCPAGQPCPVVDAAKREKTRNAAATELARAFHKDIFAIDSPDNPAQIEAVAEARVIVDVLADVALSYFGKS